MKNNERILKDALVKNNVLTENEIESYLSNAHSAGLSLKTYLISSEIVNEKQVNIALSQHLGLEILSVNNLSIEPDLIEKVPIKFASYYKFMPVRLENNILTIACADPLDIKTQDEIRLHLGFGLNPVLIDEKSLADLMKQYYGLASETIDKIMKKEPILETISSSDSGQWIEDLERKTEDPTVSNLVNQIILDAYKKRATDIHIEPYRDKVRFRYRIDGALVDANLPDNVKHFLPRILSRIKILANLSITEKRFPQDGSAVVKTSEQNLDLRISTMPTPRGESMVIRILPTKAMLLSLEKLGFNKKSVVLFRQLLKEPHGIIFMTGPTGSGKTTTLYACLNEINSDEKKIITIEDPIEYEMHGITQVQVNPKVNFGFSEGLRSLLRHDPDIIMVGEVRDVETAEISIRTALTGHLVFSTLHTNDSASGITRLIDMGVESYLVASSVEAFIAQRLVRVICPKCKEQTDDVFPAVKEEIQRALDLDSMDEVKIYHGKGCDYCNQTGYYGRIAIYEILRLNTALRNAILNKPRSDYIKRMAIKEGLVTLRQNGWQAVIDGITTPEEVLNVTVKDEILEEPEDAGPAKKVLRQVRSEMTGKRERIKVKNRENWERTNQYDARVYPRVKIPVEIRYRLLKLDPDDDDFLLSDGTEYTTMAEDISAGGLRFISNGAHPIGSILELKIILEADQPAVTCLAKVCRVEEDHLDNIYTMVNYYLDLSSADRVLLSKFVEKKIEEKGRSAS